jgi:tRNA(Ile)-lysidine synthase
VSRLAQRVLNYIRGEELLHAGDRVGVAVSGGIDSVALLRLLLELRSEVGFVLSVVHFNHELRGAESDADQEFVAKLASQHGLEFYSERGDVAKLAADEHSGVEAAARELRYGFFYQLLGAGAECGSVAEAMPFPVLPSPVTRRASTEFPSAPVPLSHPLHKIVTGHTLDDQAETVLMRLIRGTGLRGLGGIYARVVVENDDDEEGPEHGEIVRPLLRIRRRELEQYLTDLNQPWRDDATNADSTFTRNRVRKLVLPLLEREFNPAVVESLAQLAEIARDEGDYWENEISGWLGTVVQWSQPEWLSKMPALGASQPLVQIGQSRPKHTADLPDRNLAEPHHEPGPAVANLSVSLPWMLSEPKAVQRRMLKAIGEQAKIPLEFKHVEEIISFATEDGAAGKELSLPLGWKVIREPEAIVFITPDLQRQERISDYEYALAVPGRVAVPEIGAVIEALRIAPETHDAEYNRQQLLRAELLPGRLSVRNWRAGDRYWPPHTKSPKKIKQLLHERQIARQERRLWPVVAGEDEIVWMRGFQVPARLRSDGRQEAILIRELPWADDENEI